MLELLVVIGKVKDIQDMKGDQATGYRTLPVIWGMNSVRAISVIIVIITMTILAIGQWYLYQKGFNLPFWYLMIAVQSIFVYLLYLLFITKETEAYIFLSNTAKLIMVAGILSMELIYISL